MYNNFVICHYRVGWLGLLAESESLSDSDSGYAHVDYPMGVKRDSVKYLKEVKFIPIRFDAENLDNYLFPELESGTCLHSANCRKIVVTKQNSGKYSIWIQVRSLQNNGHVIKKLTATEAVEKLNDMSVALIDHRKDETHV